MVLSTGYLTACRHPQVFLHAQRTKQATVFCHITQTLAGALVGRLTEQRLVIVDDLARHTEA
jgi:hypothetical protein